MEKAETIAYPTVVLNAQLIVTVPQDNFVLGIIVKVQVPLPRPLLKDHFPTLIIRELPVEEDFLVPDLLNCHRSISNLLGLIISDLLNFRKMIYINFQRKLKIKSHLCPF